MQVRIIGYKYKINSLKYSFYEPKVMNYFITKCHNKKKQFIGITAFISCR